MQVQMERELKKEMWSAHAPTNNKGKTTTVGARVVVATAAPPKPTADYKYLSMLTQRWSYPMLFFRDVLLRAISPCP